MFNVRLNGDCFCIYKYTREGGKYILCTTRGGTICVECSEDIPTFSVPGVTIDLSSYDKSHFWYSELTKVALSVFKEQLSSASRLLLAFRNPGLFDALCAGDAVLVNAYDVAEVLEMPRSVDPSNDDLEYLDKLDKYVDKLPTWVKLLHNSGCKSKLLINREEIENYFPKLRPEHEWYAGLPYSKQLKLFNDFPSIWKYVNSNSVQELSTVEKVLLDTLLEEWR